jgi:hypothetical protein
MPHFAVFSDLLVFNTKFGAGGVFRFKCGLITDFKYGGSDWKTDGS